jgi:hypothetical protein
MPLIGAGSGSFDAAASEALMRSTLERLDAPLTVTLVRFRS